jgi:hypothetical protein
MVLIIGYMLSSILYIKCTIFALKSVWYHMWMWLCQTICVCQLRLPSLYDFEISETVNTKLTYFGLMLSSTWTVVTLFVADNMKYIGTLVTGSVSVIHFVLLHVVQTCKNVVVSTSLLSMYVTRHPCSIFLFIRYSLFDLTKESIYEME